MRRSASESFESRCFRSRIADAVIEEIVEQSDDQSRMALLAIGVGDSHRPRAQAVELNTHDLLGNADTSGFRSFNLAGARAPNGTKNSGMRRERPAFPPKLRITI